MPAFIPEWFLCCQQKPGVFIMQFASSLKHNSIGWIWAKPAKHLETILSALSTVQSSTPGVRVQLRVSTRRKPGSFWDIEIWSDAFISGFRSIYIAALPKRIAPKSSLQALRGLERDVVIQRIKEETSLYTERVCYVPSPAFGENGWSLLVMWYFICQIPISQWKWKARGLLQCYVLHLGMNTEWGKRGLNLATTLTDASGGFCDSTVWGSSLLLPCIYLHEYHFSTGGPQISVGSCHLSTGTLHFEEP